MPVYLYKAVGSDGVLTEGKLEADNENAAVEHLQMSGMYPISTVDAARPSNFTLGKRAGLSGKELIHFTRQLGTMLNAGLSLDVALKSLSRMTRQARSARVLENLRASIEGGLSLSDALSEDRASFSALYVNLVRAGESSGTLPLALQHLGTYLEKRQKLRQAVLSALLYPAILGMTSLIALAILLTYVIPRFEPLFEDLGAALPASTHLVVATSAAITAHWWAIALLPLLAAMIFRVLSTDSVWRMRVQKQILRAPLCRELVRRLEVARLSRTLGTLLSNGVPLLTAAYIARDSSNNLVFRQGIDTVITNLQQGRGLSQPLRETSLFPELALEFIEIGEGSGSLPEMLMRIADIYDDEVDQMTKRFLTIFEPSLILAMGALIGFIIVSILLAVLSLNDLVL